MLPEWTGRRGGGGGNFWRGDGTLLRRRLESHLLYCSLESGQLEWP